MGGEAAKERRRLKRVQAQEKAEGAAKLIPPSTTKHGREGEEGESNSTGKRKDMMDETNSADLVHLRLQRKTARRSSGNFKAPSERITSSPAHKRNPGNGKAIKSSHPLSKMTKQAKNTSSNNNVRNKKGDRPAKKNIHMKPKLKKKKPKHLQRKMNQLSKAMSGAGGNGADGHQVSDIEMQMDKLVKQMEEYKRLKQKNPVSSDPAPADVPKESPNENSWNGNSARRNTKKGTGNGSAVRENEETSHDPASSQSFDSGSNVDETNRTKSDLKQSTSTTPRSPSQSFSHGDSSSDEDDITGTANVRSRGNRRRGRRDSKTTKETLESDKPEGGEAARASGEVPQNDIVGSSEKLVEDQSSSKKTPRKGDKRRCIGRKPVTDYVIGKRYSGKVRYIKPKLGAFIDIGCHSDAFCHISCTSDEFVTTVTDVLKLDSMVDARVVDINREKKQITVTLRSDKLDEQRDATASLQFERSKECHVRVDAADPKVVANPDEKVAGQDPGTEHSKSHAELKRERKLARRAERRNQENSADVCDNSTGQNVTSTAPAPTTPPTNTADLKRERKLARRAERRAARQVATSDT
ncbi:hypothetical protein ACHAWF_014216 [Thalassiosira exigua]